MSDRVLFGGVKPYFAPSSLDLLEGPRDGTVELPHSVLWAPGGGVVDLDEPGGTNVAYQALLNEGTVDDQIRWLNRERLIEWWPRLRLPVRVRTLWQGRSPELSARAVLTRYEFEFDRPYSRPSHSIATEVRNLREHPEVSDVEAWRHVISQTIDTYDSRLAWGALQDAIATFEEAPELTGRPGIDAGVAGLAEYLALRDGWAVPSWALEPTRACAAPWFVRDLPSVRARAQAESPEPFRRRGVFITSGALERW